MSKHDINALAVTDAICLLVTSLSNGEGMATAREALRRTIATVLRNDGDATCEQVRYADAQRLLAIEGRELATRMLDEFKQTVSEALGIADSNTEEIVAEARRIRDDADNFWHVRRALQMEETTITPEEVIGRVRRLSLLLERTKDGSNG